MRRANQDAVFVHQFPFQQDAVALGHPHQHEVGARGQCLQAVDGVDGGVELLCFLQILVDIEVKQMFVFQDIKAGLHGQCVHGPGHAVHAQRVDKGQRTGDISQPKAGNGIFLGHGMEQDDVAHLGCLARLQQFFAAEEGITLVDDEDGVWVAECRFHQLALRYDAARGVVGVAEPHHVHLVVHLVERADVTYLMSVEPAGILVFAECGHHDGRVAPAIIAAGAGGGQCNEIDGLGGSAGNEVLVLPVSVAHAEHPFRQRGLDGRVVAYTADAFPEVFFQSGHADGMEHIRTEIVPDGSLVFVDVVAVSLNHAAKVSKKNDNGLLAARNVSFFGDSFNKKARYERCALNKSPLFRWLEAETAHSRSMKTIGIMSLHFNDVGTALIALRHFQRP